MATSWTAIASTTVGSGGVSSVTFSSIPSTYTDLLIYISARTSRANTDDVIDFQFNGSTANFTWQLLVGTGTATSAGSGTNNIMAGRATGTLATANTFSNNRMYIMNYASSNYKSFTVDGVIENNATATQMDAYAGLWSNTAAITSLNFYPETGPLFLQYSTFTLFGVKNT